MHIAIIGAGYSGLTTASALISFNHTVVIFDSTPDVGGVWSSVNHYPGLKAQNNKDSYCFSTLPMPKEYPTHPTGQQVQAYLESYARKEGLYEDGRLRLGTRVVKAERIDHGWILKVHSSSHGSESLSFDYLICATGVFSQPYIPTFNGIDKFTQTGGNGESLFSYIRPTKAQKSLDSGFLSPLRVFLFATLSFIISIQLKLSNFNLIPNKPFGTIARSSISLVTPGFVQALEQGKLRVERDTTINSLQPGKAILSNGKELPADIIICGTGWTHNIPSFLPKEYKSKLLNSDGDWVLYRHILPIGIEDLAFIGFNSSIFCPLTAEITSIWLASYLEDLSSNSDIKLIKLPNKNEQKELAEKEVIWHRMRTDGHHANGTSIVPFSLSNIDEMLNDLNVRFSWTSWLREWLLPVKPAAYRNILPTVLKRRNGEVTHSKKVA